MSRLVRRLRASAGLLSACVAVSAAAVAFSAPVRAATCTTNQCTLDMTPKIYLLNDEWNNYSGAYGTSTITTNSATSWSCSWDFNNPNLYQVIAYQSAVLGWHYGFRVAGTGLPVQLSAHTPVISSTAYNVTGTLTGDVAYDIWCHDTPNPGSQNGTDEIMIWLGVYHVGPSMPIVGTPTIDGTTWDVYHPTSGQTYTAFLLHGGGNRYDITPKTLNITDFMDWMVNNGYIASTKYLTSVMFGVETDNTCKGTLNVTNYTCAVGGALITSPSAPTGLTATAGNARVSLTWSASSGATSYNVKRSTVNGLGYVTVASPTTTSYTNTGLSNGTTYYFVVTAVNPSGQSGNSNQASATPQAGAVGTGGATASGGTSSGGAAAGAAGATGQAGAASNPGCGCSTAKYGSSAPFVGLLLAFGAARLRWRKRQLRPSAQAE